MKGQTGMRFVVHALTVSPHVVPLLDELVRQHSDIDLTYVATSWRGTDKSDDTKKGWDSFSRLNYVLNEDRDKDAVKDALENSEVLYSGFRCVDLFERRLRRGLLTYYAPERWYKPIVVFDRYVIPRRFRLRIRLPGIVRLLVPSYRRTAWRIVRLLDHPHFIFLAIGVHAVGDIVRTQKILSGAWWYYFVAPKVTLERKLGGRVEGFPRIRLWDYSVKPGLRYVKPLPVDKIINVLWVGRMLHWKYAQTVVRSVKGDSHVRLTLLGMGDELIRCRRLASGANNICFHEPEDLDGVRRLMHENDVLVMSSNAEEGWGAVVSEAVEEGLRVIGTYEAGASATILPQSNLFHAKDVKRLRELLHSELAVVDAREWSAEAAAKWLIADWLKQGKLT